MSNSEHSPLGPSSFKRCLACPGSLELGKVIGVEDESEEAQIGTRLHKILSDPNTKHDLKDLNDWHLEALQKAFTFQEQMIQAFDDCEILREHKVDLTFIHPEVGFGTLDLALVKPFDFAVISDYKFFFQKGLDPAESNKQLQLYAIGLMREYELKRVKAYLFMPHVNAQSEAEWSAEDLEFMQETFSLNVSEILVNKFRFSLGDHCRHCKAMPLCPAQLSLVYRTDQKQLFTEMSGEKIGEFLDKGEHVKKWYENLSTFARKMVIDKKLKIPGYGLFNGRNARSWATEGEKLVSKLTAIAGKIGKDAKDFWTVPEVKSPAQVEEVWGKSKKVSEELNKIIQTKAGALVLRKIVEEKGTEDAKT